MSTFRSYPSLLAVCLLSCLPAAGLSQLAAQEQRPATTNYSLKTVETTPIPRQAHFALWKAVALGACSDSKSRFNLDPTACASLITRRADMCIAKYEAQTPALITTRAESRSIGRNFLYCATPYYFCNGVEVKTEAEVLAKCR